MKKRWVKILSITVIAIGLPVAVLYRYGILAQIPWVQGVRGATPGTTVLITKTPVLPKNLAQRQLQADRDPNNWLLYGRNYQAWRYSPLTQITRQNVGKLALAWQFDTGMHNAFEASPIVIDGTMYVSTPWNHVLALNAVTGKLYWRYAYALAQHPILCCDAVNRGVGVGAGKVVMVTVDAHIVALDARTGKEAWNVAMANAVEGYSATLAPQIIGNKAIVGISGGEYGIRGFIDAYDIRTGKRLWRFHTTAGPGQRGHGSWQGDSWKTGGCPQWMTCTYDPATKTIFAGIGNAGPDLDGGQRAGNNLFATCVVALDVDTGHMKWYYQTVPHDVWDLDCTVCPIIDDLTIDGKQRKVVMFTPKNGYFYMLDRTNGKPIYAMQVAHNVSWGTVTPNGVPHPNPANRPNTTGVTVAPGASGGKEWSNEAYDPVRKRMFIPLIEEPFKHTLHTQKYIAGEWYWGGMSEPQKAYGHIAAVDVLQKKILWDVHTANPQICSISCTATGLVITGTSEQTMLIMDADTGKPLWRYTALSGFHGNPVSFAVNGKQYITFPNGWGGPPQRESTSNLSGIPIANTIYTFALP